jgi:hypothetical protein
MTTTDLALQMRGVRKTFEARMPRSAPCAASTWISAVASSSR